MKTYSPRRVEKEFRGASLFQSHLQPIKANFLVFARSFDVVAEPDNVFH